jgi:hypothetical protein
MVADILGIETETLGDAGLAIITVLGGAAALLTVGAALREWYRRTLGRRRDRYERLARLGTQAHLTFFESVLGEPPAMRKTKEATVEEYAPDLQATIGVEREFIECIFIDRDYYVLVVCDEEETVLAFSVTTRSKRFRPRFTFPPRPDLLGRRRWKKRVGQPYRPFFDIKLGKSRFADLPNEPQRPRIGIEHGARTYSYTELFGYGNPSHYQSFGFTASSAVAGAIGPLVKVSMKIGRGWGHTYPDDDLDAETTDLMTKVRRETVITTFTVLGPSIHGPENYPSTFGPHGDEVRTLP